jgi:BRCA1-associated protein
LIQNAGDGKLVEVNDPTNTTSKERSLNPGLSDAQEGEVVHRKLEGFASQYYTLLKSQLEQQRIYYESRLEEIRREHGIGRNTRHGVGSQKRVGSTADLISAFKQDRNQLEQRCMTLRRKYKKVAEDAAFYKNMNESLEANKAPMKRQILEAQRELAEASDMIHNCLPPLEAQVQNLMLQLDNGNPGISSVTQNGLNDDSKPRARKM